MIRMLYFVILFALALACGGGVSEDTPQKISLKIEMVYPNTPSRGKTLSSRQKYATLDENTPFRIGTDQSEQDAVPVGDPLHATHARARFFQNGEYVAGGISEIIRYSTDSSLVDPVSRNVVVRGVPTDGPLFLTLELGKDLRGVDAPYEEAIYYSGNVDNIVLSGSNLIVSGNFVDTIFVPLHTNIANGFYQLQCYVDYSSLPIVAMPLEKNPLPPSIVSINPPVGNGSIDVAAPKLQLISGNMFDFQGLFFEVFEIPISQQKLDFAINSGGNINMVLYGMVLPEETLAGLPVVFDWETTFVRWLVKLHEDTSGTGLYARPSGNVIAVHREIEEVFPRVDRMMSPSANVTTPIEVMAQDFPFLQFGYKLAGLCNDINANGVRLGTAGKVNTEILSSLSTNYETGVNFFLSSGNAHVPIKINFDASSVDQSPLYLLGGLSGNLVDASGNFISAENGNLGSANFIINDLFKSRVVDPYYNIDAMWNYIESFTDLELITADNTEE